MKAPIWFSVLHWPIWLNRDVSAYFSLLFILHGESCLNQERTRRWDWLYWEKKRKYRELCLWMKCENKWKGRRWNKWRRIEGKIQAEHSDLKNEWREERAEQGNVWRKQRPPEGKEKRKIKVKQPQQGKQAVSQKNQKHRDYRRETGTRPRISSHCREETQCSGSSAAAKSLQSRPTLCDPIDSSPPGSPVPGILQARTLEWGAISFSQ